MQVSGLESSNLENNDLNLPDVDGVFSKIPTLAEAKYQFRRKFKSLSKANKKVVAVMAIILPLMAVGLGTQYLAYNQDNRSEASIKQGPALIVLAPNKTTVARREVEETQVLVTTDGHPVIGLQLVAKVTGDIPDDLAIIPESIPGLQLIISDTQSMSDGKEIRLVYLISPDASSVDSTTGETTLQPYSTLTPLKIGTIRFTGENRGNMTVSFDPSRTLIIESGTNTDLANLPDDLVYTFSREVVESSPSPVASPYQESSPSPEVSFSPSPSPEASLSPSPSVGTKPGKGNGRSR